jgi:hypothetical protein
MFLSPKNTQSISSSLERCSVLINISRGDIKLEKKGPIIDEKDIREIKRIKVNHAGEKVLNAMKDILWTVYGAEKKRKRNLQSYISNCPIVASSFPPLDSKNARKMKLSIFGKGKISLLPTLSLYQRELHPFVYFLLSLIYQKSIPTLTGTKNHFPSHQGRLRFISRKDRNTQVFG